MAAASDPFEVLGVPAGADDETIKRAFRALAREHHPDVSAQPDAGRRFRELVEAYERLAVPRASRHDPAVDVAAIADFYAWLAARGRAPEPEPEPEPRRAARGVQLAAAAALAYALVLLLLLLAR